MSDSQQAEFSHIVPIEDVLAKRSSKGMNVKLSADADICAALAKRFSIVSIDDFSIFFNARPLSRGVGRHLIRVKGQLNATIQQNCVISFVPVTQIIDEEVNLKFSLAIEDNGENDVDISFSSEDEEIYDSLEGNDIDFGEIAAQQLALAIDPYPRVEGATLEQLKETVKTKNLTVNERNSPFAVLGGLKNKK
jgi:uncharacterized metal-binding protein YceD (DUF177 family)